MKARTRRNVRDLKDKERGIVPQSAVRSRRPQCKVGNIDFISRRTLEPLGALRLKVFE